MSAARRRAPKVPRRRAAAPARCAGAGPGGTGREEMMETKARLRGARMSAQKGRLVADLIRGKPVDQAINILAFSPKKGAGIMRKLLESAIANAEHNDGADIDELKVKTHLRRARHVPQALPGARQGPRQPRAEAHVPYLHRRWVTDGPEDQSRRLPPCGEQELEFALVCEHQELRADAGRGHQGARFPEAEARARLGRPGPDRAAGEERAHHDLLSARPGVVIGKKGEDIEALKAELRRMMGVQQVHVNIEEIRKPEIDAQLIADSIAQQLEKRIMFRRAMKRAMQNAMRLGAQGIKIMSAGRLNGIEIARTEWYREGRVPLHTLRADIDYGFARSEDDLRRDRHQGLGLQGRGDAEGRDAGHPAGSRSRHAAARGAGRAQARQEAGAACRAEARGPARPRPEGAPRAARKDGAPAPKTTVKKAKKLEKPEGEKKE